jgi:hypothetical protein
MILKKKIERSNRIFLRKLSIKMAQKVSTNSNSQKDPSLPSSVSQSRFNYQESLKLKNLCKNYTRAICTFILADAAIIYLELLVQELNISISEFRAYIKEKKDEVKGVNELRSLLIIQAKDSPKSCSYKKSFQRLAEIFVKYFSVNWIFSSKLEYRMDYLKARHRLLRRIKDPLLLVSSPL